MKKDFIIDQSIALVGEGYYLDVHNNYDYKDLTLVSENNSAILKLFFKKTSGAWVKESDPDSFILCFNNVQFLEFSREIFHIFSELFSY
ncbi:MAG TPA: hypothetical protein VGE63_01900 [Candidatus Paceibacterota bacterium]